MLARAIFHVDPSQRIACHLAYYQALDFWSHSSAVRRSGQIGVLRRAGRL